jgi:S-(hydroxymethyl)glutathione dehydrogenase/alcohol dehydrogenase
MLDGQDPEGLFPCILGHKAGHIVKSVGEGGTSEARRSRDSVLHTSVLRDFLYLLQVIQDESMSQDCSTQGQVVMPDGTKHFLGGIHPRAFLQR